MMDEQDIRDTPHISFTDAKTGGQLFLVARHAHQYGDALAVDHDLQGLFDDDTFLLFLAAVLPYALDGPGQARVFFSRFVSCWDDLCLTHLALPVNLWYTAGSILGSLPDFCPGLPEKARAGPSEPFRRSRSDVM